MVGKRNLQNPRDPDNEDPRTNDLETGFKKRKFPRFRDAVDLAMQDKTTSVLKKDLLAGIDRNEFERYRKNADEIKECKSKEVRKFYENQNARLDDWLEIDALVTAMAEGIIDSMNPDADRDGVPERTGALQGVGERVEELLPEDARERQRKGARNARWAININVIVNILLLAAKAIAALRSSSLSLMASLVDSALDLLCTVIIWSTNKVVQWRFSGLERRFPVGRRRLEPIGILVFSIIMIISFVQILQESVMKLLPGGEKEAAELPPVAIGAMLATVIVKGILWFGCIRVKTTQVQALAQDCRTDVVFNTMSLLFPLIGRQFNIWWLDPAGAAILSLFIIYDWTMTMLENVFRLSGSAVEDHLQKKLTFLAYRFSPIVNGFKNIVAYHAGDKVWVEYDVLLDEKMPLRRTHDISETLQYCCEGLEEVDRAFVSMDYTSQGPTGHAINH